jgi:hypothetical protein
MAGETLNFKLGLSGSHPSKCPHVTISVSGTEYFNDTLTTSTGTQYIEFVAAVPDGNSELTITFTNKTRYDTVVDSTGNVVEDMLLNIESIEVDDIDLGTILWNSSVYCPVYPVVYQAEMQKQGKELDSEVKNCVNLGWNGTWKLPFTSPFFIWLLENM